MNTQALISWAKRARAEGRYADSLALLALAARGCKKAGDKGGVAVLEQLILTLRDQGRVTEALDVTRQLLRVEIPQGKPGRIAQLVYTAASLHADPENPERDIEVAAEIARSVFEDLAIGPQRQSAIELLIVADSELGETERLEELVAQLNEYEISGDVQKAQRLWLLGLASSRLGRTMPALAMLEESATLYRAEGMPLHWGNVTLEMVLTSLAGGGDPLAASRVAGELFVLFRELEAERAAYTALQTFVQGCAAGHSDPAAARAAQQGISRAISRSGRLSAKFPASPLRHLHSDRQGVQTR